MCISVRCHLGDRVKTQEGKENKAMSLMERWDGEELGLELYCA